MAKKDAVTDAPATEEAPKKKKKLAKVLEGKVLTITESTTDTAMTFDFDKLPPAIQEAFGPFGMSHKLGDAAAGKKGYRSC